MTTNHYQENKEVKNMEWLQPTLLFLKTFLIPAIITIIIVAIIFIICKIIQKRKK